MTHPIVRHINEQVGKTLECERDLSSQKRLSHPRKTPKIGTANEHE